MIRLLNSFLSNSALGGVGGGGVGGGGGPVSGGALPHGQPVVQINKTGWTTVNTSPSNVQSAINAAGSSGTIINVSNGTISGTVDVAGKQNLCIIAANQGQVTISGTWNVYANAQNIEFNGIRVTGRINTGNGNGKTGSATNLVFERCLLDSFAPSGFGTGDSKVLLYPGTRHIRFGYCEIDGNGYAGRWAIYQRCRTSTDDPKYLHIHDCLIRNTSGSAIRIGDTSFIDREVNAEAVVEYCYFINNFNKASDGNNENELIVGKASRGWVRYCTFQGVGTDRSSISLRHCSRWTVHDNILIDMGGIIGSGTEHKIYNNLLINCDYNFRVFAGHYDWDNPGSQNPPPSIYPASERSVWANNTVVLTSRSEEAFSVGYMWDSFQSRVTSPATNNDFVNNLIHRISGSGIPIRRELTSLNQTANRFSNNLSNVSGSSSGTAVTVGATNLVQSGSIWKLSSGSDAINAGIPITNYGVMLEVPRLTITTDFEGETRSNFDIGCDEFSASNPGPLGLITQSDVGVNAPERTFPT